MNPLKCLVAIGLAVATAGPAFAQSPAPTPAAPTPPLLFGATFEGYISRNANRPDSQQNLYRAYDVTNGGFGIQQAVFVLEAPTAVDEGRRFGLRLDLQFGQAVATVQGNTSNEPRPDLYRNVWQAYGTYVFPVGKGLTVDFGKFGSSLGLETNYAKDGDHFSRALLFFFLPFYHEGLRASLPLTERVTAYYMLSNGAQQTEDFNRKRAHHGMVIAKLPGNLQLTGSAYGTTEPSGRVRIVDVQAAWTPSHPIAIGVDVNHTSSRPEGGDTGVLNGLGTYVRATRKSMAAALRYEWLDDKGGLMGNGAQRLQEVTATGEWRPADGFLVRLEARRDFSDQSVFPARDFTTSTSQTTLTAGVVWWVGTKKGAW